MKAIVTGATSGIGEATAIILAKNGYDLVITGRREERLQQLSVKLQQAYGVQVRSLVFDVRQKEQVYSALETLPEDWTNIDVLINNAGLSLGLDAIHKGDTNDWETMIDTNIKGLLYVTKVVSNWMVVREKGHIVNIGSIAGKEAYLNGNVYCATKHAVDALNKSMRVDLLPYGIRVTGIHPAATETEFSEVRFKGDETRAKQVYEGYTPLSAEDIAEVIWFAVSRPAHVNLSDILITPTAQANTVHYHKKS